MVLALAGSGLKQAQSTGLEKPGAATKPASTKPAAKPITPRGQSDGIKVHGHWTIEVRNPDGTLAKHSEFENSLATPSAFGPGETRIHFPSCWFL
jgi:hypothetical protein